MQVGLWINLYRSSWGRQRGCKAELGHGVGPAIDKSRLVGEDLLTESLEMACLESISTDEKGTIDIVDDELGVARRGRSGVAKASKPLRWSSLSTTNVVPEPMENERVDVSDIVASEKGGSGGGGGIRVGGLGKNQNSCREVELRISGANREVVVRVVKCPTGSVEHDEEKDSETAGDSDACRSIMIMVSMVTVDLSQLRRLARTRQSHVWKSTLTKGT
ncbi:uncharacterized protein F5147DRAFT_650655 [Suillus discolor]|uniref:Uncharacterized protein n=1 Tax=Suillus discolor TaxID=1912936 RepID=A0A9P7JX93_9AGAM|nr:uncharacterized protein F5147DRAFT_650655 [Suillus discolor]KAG2113120.1 hypothetical protein F5147DRAFT_650655 [Suillus discolor]